MWWLEECGAMRETSCKQHLRRRQNFEENLVLMLPGTKKAMSALALHRVCDQQRKGSRTHLLELLIRAWGCLLKWGLVPSHNKLFETRFFVLPHSISSRPR